MTSVKRAEAEHETADDIDRAGENNQTL